MRVPAIRDGDVLLTNMQRILGPVISEHVIALMLGLTRGLHEFIPAQGEHRWRREPTAGKMSVIEGIRTTIPMHLKILNEPDFIAGRLSTHFMERFAPKPKATALAESA